MTIEQLKDKHQEFIIDDILSENRESLDHFNLTLDFTIQTLENVYIGLNGGLNGRIKNKIEELKKELK